MAAVSLSPQSVSITSALYEPNKKQFFEDVQNGNLPGVKAYAEADGYIEARDAEGFSALMRLTLIATSDWTLAHTEVFNYLVEQEIDVNGTYTCSAVYYGRTALHFAAFLRAIPMVKLLLKAGAIVDFKDADGDTPLHVACSHGYEDVVRLLLNHDADPNIAPPVLSRALVNGNGPLVALLCTSKVIELNYDLDYLPGLAGSPLSIAARHYIQAVPRLIALGAEIDRGFAEQYNRWSSLAQGIILRYCIEGCALKTIGVARAAKLIGEYAQPLPEGDVADKSSF